MNMPTPVELVIEQLGDTGILHVCHESEDAKVHIMTNGAKFGKVNNRSANETNIIVRPSFNLNEVIAYLLSSYKAEK